MDWEDVRARVEPALSCARAQLDALECAAARAALESCGRFLKVCRDPMYRNYDPGDLLRALADRKNPRWVVEVESSRTCSGDAEQIGQLLTLLLESAVLETGSLVIVRLQNGADTLRISVLFDGPGHFPEVFALGASIYMTFSEFGDQWTAATGGGGIVKKGAGIELRLAGGRAVSKVAGETETLLELIREACTRLEEGKSASDGAGGKTRDSVMTTRDVINRALGLVDGPAGSFTPTDLHALIQQTIAERSPSLDGRSISVENLSSSALPPIAVRRDRLRVFFHAALAFAEENLHAGGSVTFMALYERATRCVEIKVSVAGKMDEPDSSCLLYSMKRAVMEDHGGGCEWSRDGARMDFEARIPDPVGQALDAWIPGWEGFSDQSQQMLRMVQARAGEGKDDALTQVVLSELLEKELERWLLPVLSLPAIVNAAHDIEASASAVPGASGRRLEKAFGQIRKGKPRKEIAKPLYAGELLRVFGRVPRLRSVLRVDHIPDEEVGLLSTNLLQERPEIRTCLRIIARIVGGSGADISSRSGRA